MQLFWRGKAKYKLAEQMILSELTLHPSPLNVDNNVSTSILYCCTTIIGRVIKKKTEHT